MKFLVCEMFLLWTPGASFSFNKCVHVLLIAQNASLTTSPYSSRLKALLKFEVGHKHNFEAKNIVTVELLGFLKCTEYFGKQVSARKSLIVLVIALVTKTVCK